MRILFVLLLIITTTGISSFEVARTAKHKSGLFSADNDSLEADRLKYMNQVMASIKGKEKLPADSVFRNIKAIRGKSSVSA